MNRENSDAVEKARIVFMIISLTALILTIIFVATLGLHIATGIAFGVQSFFSFLYGITDDGDIFSCGF